VAEALYHRRVLECQLTKPGSVNLDCLLGQWTGYFAHPWDAIKLLIAIIVAFTVVYMPFRAKRKVSSNEAVEIKVPYVSYPNDLPPPSSLLVTASKVTQIVQGVRREDTAEKETGWQKIRRIIQGFRGVLWDAFKLSIVAFFTVRPSMKADSKWQPKWTTILVWLLVYVEWFIGDLTLLALIATLATTSPIWGELLAKLH
jgi:hypothetical protein